MADAIDEIARMLMVPITEERPWVVFGACKESDPEVFFSSSREDEARALALCASCPVRPECLDYALEAGERFGIWGGLTEKQRRKRVLQLRRSA